MEEKDFQVSLAGLELEHPIFNAAGTCRLIDGTEGVEALANSCVSAIMVGSITVEPREGNKGNVFWTSPDGQFSLNSNGLPNKGAEFYKAKLPKMVEIAHEAQKLLFVSVAGFTPEEYALLAEISFGAGADLVELNLSCPNIWHDQEQKRIPCFDPKLTKDIVSAVRVGVDAIRHAKLAVKLSPFSDPYQMSVIVDAFCYFDVVKAVVMTNTFPNGFSLDEKGNPVITFGEGYGGISGPVLKPFVWGQIKQLRAFLPERVDIIGCGGITTGRDVADFLAAGATAVQVGTAFLNGGVKVFDRILSEYVDIALEAMD